MSTRSDMWTWRKVLSEWGLTARIEGDRLIVSGELCEESRAFITQHKPAIMEELRGENTLA